MEGVELFEFVEKARGILNREGLDVSQIMLPHSVSYSEMDSIAARAGFPKMYSHWKFGRDLELIQKQRVYGLSTIFELVINNHPFHAYVMEGNPDLHQKLVAIHALAHADFFNQNLYFKHTRKNMIDRFGNYATLVDKLEDRFGKDEVEEFITKCLTINNLIDENFFFSVQKKVEEEEEKQPEIYRMKAKEYMDSYINPDGDIVKQLEKIEKAKRATKSFPERPEKDVMLFVQNYAPLQNWQKMLLAMIREEAYYFLPQQQTKIMNEGWATFWHSRIMTSKILRPEELIDYAELHASCLANPQKGINPYKIGVEIFKNIEERWDSGRHGKEYEECQDIGLKEAWDTPEMKGREKIFQVRKVYKDISFIEEFFTEEAMESAKMGLMKDGKRKMDNFEDLKSQLVNQLLNMNRMPVYAVDGNFKNRGELLLVQRFDGFELDKQYMNSALKALRTLWNRPVHLENVEDGKWTRRSYDQREEVTTIEKPSVKL